jgi:hypothetical protein
VIVAFALATAVAAATPSPAPVGVTVQVQRTSFDLLDSLDIEVVVHNPGAQTQSAIFAAPAEYAIEALRDGKVVWSSAPAVPAPGATYAPHRHAFAPGPTTLVIYDWNEVTPQGRSPLPGEYTIRARLLDTSRAAATMRVTFIAPLPTTALTKLKPNEEVTMAGQLDPLRATLTDANGSVRLSRRLLAAPAGQPVVIRGYATDTAGATRTFTVERWAPLGLTPPPPPSPMPAPSPSASPSSSPAPH